ncbi:DUF6230 family protein [Actinoplanes sp. NPDC051411]|uniref:DUF6230 family protein n=1 Tax=Actinoplanes sp. NPDC051411 TaxID=3155522 RepID=UPI00341F9563
MPLAVAAGLVVALEQGAIAASFQVSGQDFKLSADHLHGDGFTQYTDLLPQTNGADGHGQKITAMSGIGNAEITNLCQTVRAPSPFGGDVVMRIEAGKGPNKEDHVTADHLLIGMSDLKGDTTFHTIQIGVDSSTMNVDGAAAHGQVGGFGQQANSVDIDHLQQTATYTSAGTFTLKGMHLHLYVGGDAAGHECFPG